jgi:hypothetical protein
MREILGDRFKEYRAPSGMLLMFVYLIIFNLFAWSIGYSQHDFQPLGFLAATIGALAFSSLAAGKTTFKIFSDLLTYKVLGYYAVCWLKDDQSDLEWGKPQPRNNPDSSQHKGRVALYFKLVGWGGKKVRLLRSLGIPNTPWCETVSLRVTGGELVVRSPFYPAGSATWSPSTYLFLIKLTDGSVEPGEITSWLIFHYRELRHKNEVLQQRSDVLLRKLTELEMAVVAAVDDPDVSIDNIVRFLDTTTRLRFKSPKEAAELRRRLIGLGERLTDDRKKALEDLSA